MRRQHGDRIRHAAAVHAAVQIAVRAGDFHFEPGDPARAERNRRTTRSPQRRVGDDDEIALQSITLLVQQASARFGEPISSSPSIRNFTFTGNRPTVFSHASTARICRKNCPLLSALPRAKIRPFESTRGSNGGTRPARQVAGRLHIVMAVDQDRRRARIWRFQFREHRRMSRRLPDFRAQSEICQDILPSTALISRRRPHDPVALRCSEFASSFNSERHGRGVRALQVFVDLPDVLGHWSFVTISCDPMDATLCILAGGESRRMGRPKAELLVRGRPILTYLLERIDW